MIKIGFDDLIFVIEKELMIYVKEIIEIMCEVVEEVIDDVVDILIVIFLKCCGKYVKGWKSKVIIDINIVLMKIIYN